MDAQTQPLTVGRATPLPGPQFGAMYPPGFPDPLTRFAPTWASTPETLPSTRPRDPDIVTAEDLAEHLGCTLQVVNEKAAAGDLPGIKYGRSWVFPRPALMQRLTEKALEEAAARRQPVKPLGVTREPRRGRRNVMPPLPKL